MEVATLTAVLEARIAAFQSNMLMADAMLKSTDQLIKDMQRDMKGLQGDFDRMRFENARQIAADAEAVEKSLGGVRDTAVETKAAMNLELGGTSQVVADAAIQKRALNEVRDAAIEARIAEAALGQQGTGVLRPFVAPGGAGQYYPGAAQAEEQLRRGAFGRFTGGREFVGGYTGTTVTDPYQYQSPIGPQYVSMINDLQRLVEQQERTSSGAFVMGGDPRYQYNRPAGPVYPGREAALASLIPREDLRRVASMEEDFQRLRSVGQADLRGADMMERMATGGDGGGGGILDFFRRDGGRNFFGGDNNRGFFTGILPGGRRAGAGAVTTGLGILAGVAPALGPAAVGLGSETLAGMGALIGGAGTLKLAFADLTAQVFTNRQAFDKLTPVQQQFVMTLKSLDEGLSHTLERIAQQNVLPGLTQALHTALSPALTTQLTGGVAAFGQGISGGANDLAKLFGSPQFAGAFGSVMQADARYLQQFIDMLGSLIDTFVHLQQAAIPFTDWLTTSTQKFFAWIDASIKAAQASGSLAHWFDMARQSLTALGHLLGSLGSLSTTFVDVIGFQNSVGVINLITRAVQTLTLILSANRNLLHDFFTGAVQAVNDLLTGLQALIRVVGAVTTSINGLVNQVDIFGVHLNTWRVILDGILVYFTGVFVVRMLLGLTSIIASIAAIGTTATATEIQLGGLRAALMALADSPVMAALLALAAVLAEIHNLSGTGTKVAQNTVVAGQAANVGAFQGKPSVTVQEPGSRSDYSITYDAATGKFSENYAKGAFVAKPQSLTLTQAAQRLGVTAQQLREQVTAATAGQTTPTTGGGGTPTPTVTTGPNTLGPAFGLGSGADIAMSAVAHATQPFAQTGLPGGSKTQILPQRFYTAIAAADFAYAQAQTPANLAREVSSRQAAIDWVKTHQGQFEGADKANLLSEGASLAQQISTLQKQAQGPARSGTGFLSTAAQNALAAAQQSLQGTPGVGASASAIGAADPTAIQARMAALRQVVNLESEDLKTLNNMTVPMKEHKALLAERVSLSRDLANNLKELGALEVGQKVAAQLLVLQGVVQKLSDAAAAYQVATTGATASQQLRAANEYLAVLERQKKQLQDMNVLKLNEHKVSQQEHDIQQKINQVHKDQRQARTDVHAERILGIGAAEQQASVESLRRRERNVLMQEARRAHLSPRSDMSLPGLIKFLQEQGIELSRSTLRSLGKINETLALYDKNHIKVATQVGQNITSRLDQINNTLKQTLTNPTNYRVPTEDELLRRAGLGHLSPERNRRLGAALAEMAEHKGKIPFGAAAAGIPLDEHGHPITAARRRLLLPVGGEAGAYGGHATTVVQHVTIHIQSTSPAQAAKQIREELLKSARRNPTQTRGPNAGRNRGLN